MYISVKNICRILEEFAPARLAEGWDNVGLLVGRQEKEVKVIFLIKGVLP